MVSSNSQKYELVKDLGSSAVVDSADVHLGLQAGRLRPTTTSSFPYLAISHIFDPHFPVDYFPIGVNFANCWTSKTMDPSRHYALRRSVAKMSDKGDVLHYIRVERKGGVAEVVLDRGKQLNKMDDDFFESFHEAIAGLAEDPEVRVILLWAEGPIFTAGLDLFKAGPALTSRTCGFSDPTQLSDSVPPPALAALCTRF